MKRPKNRSTETAKPVAVGNGGENHLYAGGTHPQMTTQQGIVIADDENSLKAGASDRPGFC
jgi:catalase